MQMSHHTLLMLSAFTTLITLFNILYFSLPEKKELNALDHAIDNFHGSPIISKEWAIRSHHAPIIIPNTHSELNPTIGHDDGSYRLN